MITHYSKNLFENYSSPSQIYDLSHKSTSKYEKDQLHPTTQKLKAWNIYPYLNSKKKSSHE